MFFYVSSHVVLQAGVTHTHSSRQVREVERVDDVEVKDQEDDAVPCVKSVNARAPTIAKRTAKTRVTSAKRTAKC